MMQGVEEVTSMSLYTPGSGPCTSGVVGRDLCQECFGVVREE